MKSAILKSQAGSSPLFPAVFRNALFLMDDDVLRHHFSYGLRTITMVGNIRRIKDNKYYKAMSLKCAVLKRYFSPTFKGYLKKKS